MYWHHLVDGGSGVFHGHEFTKIVCIKGPSIHHLTTVGVDDSNGVVFGQHLGSTLAGWNEQEFRHVGFMRI